MLHQRSQEQRDETRDEPQTESLLRTARLQREHRLQRALVLQQPPLPFQAAAEAGQASVGDDDRDRVLSVGRADGAGGLRISELFGEAAVAPGLARGDPPERLPGAALEV